MRKTYQLNVEGKNRDRLIEAAKHDIRKYVKRERSRPVPAGSDFWDFDCKIGQDELGAVPVHFAALTQSIDALVVQNESQFFVEVVTKTAQRSVRPRDTANEDNDVEPSGIGDTTN